MRSNDGFHISDLDGLALQASIPLPMEAGMAAGIIAGVGTAAAVPSILSSTAALVGTTAGGVVIASLEGAAATSAALAWLGGGAVAAGGGGMAAGTALLSAVALPVGAAVAVGVAAGFRAKAVRTMNSAIKCWLNISQKVIEAWKSVVIAEGLAMYAAGLCDVGTDLVTCLETQRANR
eukprot:jgi/Chlat1/8531/Chrsp82S09229